VFIVRGLLNAYLLRGGRMSHLPERINAMRIVSYDVESIVNSIVDLNNGEIAAEDVTLDEILDLISGWTYQDMSNPQLKVIFQDENGEEL
jgi:hypothetical protein